MKAIVINIFDTEGEDDFGGVDVEVADDFNERELKTLIADALRKVYGDRINVTCVFN